MRILLIKTSSLGDVVHNLPVVTDLRREYPEANIDWVVEESFADIARLHAGVRRVIPVALRRWRGSLFAATAWREIRDFRSMLREQTYDLVIDTQGLLKSALITRMAQGRRCGYAASSAREPLASRFYDATFEVPKNLHAVERNRRLAEQAASYTGSPTPDYGIAVPDSVCREIRFAGRQAPSHQGIPLCITSELATAVLLTATSRDDKLWPEERWIELGCRLRTKGLTCLLPAGNATERERAARLALAIPDAAVLPPMSLTKLAAQLAAARIVIGVDTGLVHLAAALGRPTLALFSASDPALTGVLATTPAVNLGTRGRPPGIDDATAAALSLL